MNLFDKLNELAAKKAALELNVAKKNEELKTLEAELVSKYGEDWESVYDKQLAIVEKWESEHEDI